MDNAIGMMLYQLDPYTEYYPSGNQDEILALRQAPMPHRLDNIQAWRQRDYSGPLLNSSGAPAACAAAT